MRKTMSMILVLVMVFTLAVPTLAADPPNPLTVEERFAAIEETYGIGMTESQGQYMPGILLEKPHAQYEQAILTNLETALSILGPNFMKRLNKAAATARNGTPYPYTITNYQGNNIEGLSIFILTYEHNTDYTSYENYGIMLSGKTVSVDSILRILAFAFLDNNIGNTDTPRGNFVGQQYGNFETAPDGFLSTWAAQSWTNDYCTIFAYMVYNNDNNKLTPNTLLWNKGKTVYDDLVEYMGTGSRATQRAAANLGIEIPKA